MSAVHIVTSDASTLCGRPRRAWTAWASVRSGATCKHCLKREARIAEEDAERLAEEAMWQRYRMAAERTNLHDALFFAERIDTPTGQMLINIIGALAVALDELGYER